MIKTADDLIKHFPRYTREGGEVKSPCPFCESSPSRLVWAGDNRLHLYADGKGFYCRQCDSANRGGNGRKTGYYTIEEVAVRLGLQVDISYDPSLSSEVLEKPLQNLWAQKQIDAAHQQVDYNFWLNEYGWAQATVDHFQLGRGTLYPRNPNTHLIPMKGLHKFGEKAQVFYYMSSRGYDKSGNKIKERSPGSSKPYLWLHTTDENDKTIVICEGETDGITAYTIGYANIAVTFGSRTWVDEKAQLIKDLGFEKIIVLVDGDAAGVVLSNEIIESFLVRKMECLQLDWRGEAIDLNELFLQKNKNRDETRSWVENRLVVPRLFSKRRTKIIADITKSTTEDDESQAIVPLDELRGTGSQSLHHQISTFIAGYDLMNRGAGQTLHLKAPPGSGKTHTLIRIAEKLAKEAIKAHANQRQTMLIAKQQIETAIQADPGSQANRDSLNRIERQLAKLSKTAVAWYGQYKDGWDDLIKTGANTTLWYNYEARSESNCQNYERVTQLGNKNHDIGLFCKTACPFKDLCEKQGYLHQEIERRQYPITFFRHQHLGAGLQDDYKYLAVVDEYSGHVLESNPVIFESHDIYPHYEGWELDVISLEMVDAINDFAEAARATLSSNAGAPQKLEDGSNNPDYTLSGARFLKKLDMHCKSIANKSLSELVETIDPKMIQEAYQPNFIGSSTDQVMMRCLPQFFGVVLRELNDYTQQADNQFPSCLHLVSGRMEVYAPHILKTRHRTPLVVADATGISSLYEAMFNRQVISYEPMIRNPNLQTEIIYGSDWTKSQINREIGKSLADRKRLVESHVMTLEGDTFDPSDVPIADDLYQSALISRSLAIVKYLAQQHESLLVVTHKDIKEVLESVVQGAYPESGLLHLSDKDRVAWGHYGSLRGTNNYEHYEAVCLIGVFRIPYNILWRRIQMWAWLLGIREYIEPDTGLQHSYYDYDSPDGVMMGHEHRSFAHRFAREFVDMVEKGEIQQSATRIRPHSTTKKKTIYFFGSRPALPFVDRLVSQSEWLKKTEDSPHHDLYRHMKKKYDDTAKFPAYREIREQFSVSNSTIRKIRKEIEALVS